MENNNQSAIVLQEQAQGVLDGTFIACIKSQLPKSQFLILPKSEFLEKEERLNLGAFKNLTKQHCSVLFDLYENKTFTDFSRYLAKNLFDAIKNLP